MPVYAFVFLLFTLTSVGLPGTSGFVGEFLALVGAYQVNTWVAMLATTGIILGPAYMLWLYRRVVFGNLTKDHLKDILDMDPGPRPFTKRDIIVGTGSIRRNTSSPMESSPIFKIL